MFGLAELSTSASLADPYPLDSIQSNIFNFGTIYTFSAVQGDLLVVATQLLLSRCDPAAR